jgi:hypothetical protein
MNVNLQDWELDLLLGLFTVLNKGKIQVPISVSSPSSGLNVVLSYDPTNGRLGVEMQSPPVAAPAAGASGPHG